MRACVPERLTFCYILFVSLCNERVLRTKCLHIDDYWVYLDHVLYGGNTGLFGNLQSVGGLKGSVLLYYILLSNPNAKVRECSNLVVFCAAIYKWVVHWLACLQTEDLVPLLRAS